MQTQPADEGTVQIQPADEGALPTIPLAGKGALSTIRLATMLGMLATAALLGVVSATAGLGVAGWIVGLATGSAATALLATARVRSDQPAMFPADWVTLTRALLAAAEPMASPTIQPATPRPAVADTTPSRAAVASSPRIVASRIVGSAPWPARRIAGGASSLAG